MISRLKKFYVVYYKDNSYNTMEVEIESETPKGELISHRDIVAIEEAIVKRYGYTFRLEIINIMEMSLELNYDEYTTQSEVD